MRSALSAYKSNTLQGIHEASPAKLVAMMLDEAINCLEIAAAASDKNNFAKKGEALGKAMSIIDVGLLGGIDYERGGEIAQNFASLYQYCLKRLLDANVLNDAATMRECAAHLIKLREGWRAAEEAERS